MVIEELKHFDENVYEAIRTMMPQLTGREPEFDREAFDALLSDDHSHLLVLKETDGNVSGMLIVALYPTLSGGMKAWIEDVVVEDRCRGRGFGKALVTYAIGFARECGVRSISLSSSPARIAANRMYRSIGFVQRETNVYLLEL